MASRWMLGMRQRQTNYKKRVAQSATTLTERKLERRKVKINKHGVIIGIESIDDHIKRQQEYAQSERISPKEWRRVYARLQSLPSIAKLPLNGDEQTIIRNKFYREAVKHRGMHDELIFSSIGDIKLFPQETIYSIEQAILRYRRLVRQYDEQKKLDAKNVAKRVKLEAIKGKK